MPLNDDLRNRIVAALQIDPGDDITLLRAALDNMPLIVCCLDINTDHLIRARETLDRMIREADQYKPE